MHIQNFHVRSIQRSPNEVFGDLTRMGTDHDTVWPAPSMPFTRTPGRLRVGETEERHGIIRAVLDELAVDEKLVWRANQTFIDGTHGFEITKTPTGCDVAHVLDAEIAWWFVPMWHLKVRAVHDRLLEGLLDRLELAPARHVRRPDAEPERPR